MKCCGKRPVPFYTLGPPFKLPGCLVKRLLAARAPSPEPGKSAGYSHSIVAGGLLEMSYTTRLMPRTWLIIRLLTSARNS